MGSIPYATTDARMQMPYKEGEHIWLQIGEGLPQEVIYKWGRNHVFIRDLDDNEMPRVCIENLYPTKLEALRARIEKCQGKMYQCIGTITRLAKKRDHFGDIIAETSDIIYRSEV